MPRWPQPQQRPKTPHRAQSPHAPGENRPPLGELPPSLRNRIAQAHLDDQGHKALARTFDLSRTTIQYTLQKESTRKSGISKPRIGRPSTLSNEKKHTLFEAIWEEPLINMRLLHQIHCPDVSLRTVQRALAKYDVKKWKSLKRPRLTPAHAAARLAWVSIALFFTTTLY